MSHVLGKATFDSSFQEEREQIVESAQSGGGYFMAGLMGFTGGVFSGLTSIVTQPYKGAQESGIGVSERKLGEGGGGAGEAWMRLGKEAVVIYQ